ncbi:hypothetical protein [Halobellus rufus]|uniref:hypothetical protein n=1 Tax=Halobellus rufus TaxID=1448860 RepID=UPI000679B6CE|nr:hypothetical protein [Halobellus rufus]
MSVTPTSTETYTCRQCGDDHAPTATVGGSFCSEHCLYRHRGEKALRQIASDHRWCATCFRQLKTTHRAADHDLETAGVPGSVRDIFIGYQYRTEHAIDGVDERDHRDNPYRHTEFTRTSCECGTVNPTDRHAVLRDLDPKATMQSLWQCLVRLERDGTLHHRPSKGAYIEAIRESGRDWIYAIGRALHADR